MASREYSLVPVYHWPPIRARLRHASGFIANCFYFARPHCATFIYPRRTISASAEYTPMSTLSGARRLTQQRRAKSLIDGTVLDRSCPATVKFSQTTLIGRAPRVRLCRSWLKRNDVRDLRAQPVPRMSDSRLTEYPDASRDVRCHWYARLSSNR